MFVCLFVVVYQNELRALSQYNDTAFYPKVAYYKATIQAKVVEFYNTQLKEALAELDSFVVDFYVAPDRVRGGGGRVGKEGECGEGGG